MLHGRNFSFPNSLISLFIQFNKSVFPFWTATAIVSTSPKESIPTVNPGFDLAQAKTSVLSVEKASPLPSSKAL